MTLPFLHIPPFLTITADTLSSMHSVNVVVPNSEVVKTAIKFAKQMCQNSPDAVQCTKKGLLIAQNCGHHDAEANHNWAPESTRVYKGENIKVRSKF
jgi:1,4-dihydroxy-2-naphthoyl-CoA synthase